MAFRAAGMAQKKRKKTSLVGHNEKRSRQMKNKINNLQEPYLNQLRKRKFGLGLFGEWNQAARGNRIFRSVLDPFEELSESNGIQTRNIHHSASA